MCNELNPSPRTKKENLTTHRKKILLSVLVFTYMNKVFSYYKSLWFSIFSTYGLQMIVRHSLDATGSRKNPLRIKKFQEISETWKVLILGWRQSHTALQNVWWLPCLNPDRNWYSKTASSFWLVFCLSVQCYGWISRCFSVARHRSWTSRLAQPRSASKSATTWKKRETHSFSPAMVSAIEKKIWVTWTILP